MSRSDWNLWILTGSWTRHGVKSCRTSTCYPGTVHKFERQLFKEAEAHPKTLAWFKRAAKLVHAIDALEVDADIVDIWALVTHWVISEDEALAYNIDTRPAKRKQVLNVLRAQSLKSPPAIRLAKRKSDTHSEFTFMDLFAGIGGFHLALTAHGGEPVFASEWDDAARVTYAINYGIVPFGDIRRFTRTVSGSSLGIERTRKRTPKPMIVAAGFPCQPFSRAGVSSRNHHGISHGLDCSAQGTLFEDILHIARAHKPDAIILENVANLATHDSGNTINVIRKEIQDAGYVIFPKWSDARNWAVIDSRSVVAQRRKRVYLVCVKKNIVRRRGNFEFPVFKERNFGIDEIIAKDDSLTEREKFDRFSISSRMWASHRRREMEHKKRGNGFRIGLMSDLTEPAPTLVARYFKDGKDCLIPNKDSTKAPRMLTPRECALLQTFPSVFRLPISKTTAYRQFGNSITVEVVRQIAGSLIRYLYE